MSNDPSPFNSAPIQPEVVQAIPEQNHMQPEEVKGGGCGKSCLIIIVICGILAVLCVCCCGFYGYKMTNSMKNTKNPTEVQEQFDAKMSIDLPEGTNPVASGTFELPFVMSYEVFLFDIPAAEGKFRARLIGGVAGNALNDVDEASETEQREAIKTLNVQFDQMDRDTFQINGPDYPMPTDVLFDTSSEQLTVQGKPTRFFIQEAVEKETDEVVWLSIEGILPLGTESGLILYSGKTDQISKEDAVKMIESLEFK